MEEGIFELFEFKIENENCKVYNNLTMLQKADV